MRVLVAVGSKYGATREIAKRIADELSSFGYEVDNVNAHDAAAIDSYDAVVVGSAVYGGLWRRDARELVSSNLEALRKVPVWLFSSGPVGLSPVPGASLGEGARLAEQLDARGHEVFSGALDMNRLNMGERAVVRGMRVRAGDYREWGAVKSWAREIGHALNRVAGEIV